MTILEIPKIFRKYHLAALGVRDKLSSPKKGIKNLLSEKLYEKIILSQKNGTKNLLEKIF